MTSRRNTIQKDLVRNAVCEMKRHVTANEVYEFVKGIFADYYKIGICEGNREERTIGGILCRVH